MVKLLAANPLAADKFVLAAGPYELRESATSFYLRYVGPEYRSPEARERHFGSHEMVARILSGAYKQSIEWGTPLFYELLSKSFASHWPYFAMHYFHDRRFLPQEGQDAE
jgi:hypothetical protein